MGCRDDPWLPENYRSSSFLHVGSAHRKWEHHQNKPFVGVRIATTSHMMASKNEFKVFVIRRPKKSQQPVRFSLHHIDRSKLFVDGILMIMAVQRVENILDQFLLVRIKSAWNAVLGVNIPPVANVLPSWMVDRQTDLFSLRFT